MRSEDKDEIKDEIKMEKEESGAQKSKEVKSSSRGSDRHEKLVLGSQRRKTRSGHHDRDNVRENVIMASPSFKNASRQFLLSFCSKAKL